MNHTYKCFYELCRLETELVEVVDILTSIIEDSRVEKRLNEIKEYDISTYEHSKEVAMISILIAKDLGLSEQESRELGIGALLHDYGKIKVPLEIINKPGRISIVEREIIEAHPALGMYFLSDDGFSEGTLNGIYEHHESYVGSERGYPRKLIRDEIHLYGRIIGIADKISAYCQKRQYHEARDMTQLMWFIMECDDLDPKLVDIVKKRIDR